LIDLILFLHLKYFLRDLVYIILNYKVILKSFLLVYNTIYSKYTLLVVIRKRLTLHKDKFI